MSDRAKKFLDYFSRPYVRTIVFLAPSVLLEPPESVEWVESGAFCQSCLILTRDLTSQNVGFAKKKKFSKAKSVRKEVISQKFKIGPACAKTSLPASAPPFKKLLDPSLDLSFLSSKPQIYFIHFSSDNNGATNRSLPCLQWRGHCLSRIQLHIPSAWFIIFRVRAISSTVCHCFFLPPSRCAASFIVCEYFSHIIFGVLWWLCWDRCSFLPFACSRLSYRFEKKYDPIPVLDWMRDNSMIPVAAVALYAVLIFAGQYSMRNKPAGQWRNALAVWNLGLSLFSWIGMARTLPQLLHNLSTMSLRDNFCLDPRTTYGSGSTGLWVQLFILSKFP